MAELNPYASPQEDTSSETSEESQQDRVPEKIVSAFARFNPWVLTTALLMGFLSGFALIETWYLQINVPLEWKDPNWANPLDTLPFPMPMGLFLAIGSTLATVTLGGIPSLILLNVYLRTKVLLQSSAQKDLLYLLDLARGFWMYFILAMTFNLVVGFIYFILFATFIYEFIEEIL
ncbi:Hypothetical protein PBC10988_20080 [Planctomycetales bacterium 10988]|nr:Hypothetical protein PBC10988_20080 [Planctomycetales bacterium 10988]